VKALRLLALLSLMTRIRREDHELWRRILEFAQEEGESQSTVRNPNSQEETAWTNQ
jgi:hypothetical protein